MRNSVSMSKAKKLSETLFQIQINAFGTINSERRFEGHVYSAQSYQLCFTYMVV